MRQLHARLLDQMIVDLPEGTSGDIEIKHHTTTGTTREELIADLIGRPVPIGTNYTSLYQNGVVWMSDTFPERYDHIEAATEMHHRGGRVLIAGLGIGCILRTAILSKVAHIDLVELNEDIIDLVGPHYRSLAEAHGVELEFVNQDLLTLDWPHDAHWTVAWFDIWEGIHDYRKDHAALLARYQDHADWIGFWGENWTGMTVNEE